MNIEHFPLPSAFTDDPPPVAPEPPLPSDCCESGCPICVHDLYAQELDAYRQALADWLRRHPGAG